MVAPRRGAIRRRASGACGEIDAVGPKSPGSMLGIGGAAASCWRRRGSMAAIDGTDGLLGTWMLESVRLRMEDTGEVVEPFGPDPRGSIIFTPDGRMMTVIAASRRTPPTTEPEMAAVFRGMMAYTGRFTVE